MSAGTEGEHTSRGAGVSRQPAPHHKHPPYVTVAVWLLVVTIAEVVWALLPINDLIMVPVLLIMMALKALGVVGWYMHLKSDSRVFTLLASGPFLISVGLIIVLFTLFGGFAERFF